jgi:hypothetical protein
VHRKSRITNIFQRAHFNLLCASAFMRAAIEREQAGRETASMRREPRIDVLDIGVETKGMGAELPVNIQYRTRTTTIFSILFSFLSFRDHSLMPSAPKVDNRTTSDISAQGGCAAENLCTLLRSSD